MLPISPDFIEGIKGAALAGDDVFGGLAPDKGLWLGVVLQKVVVDGVLEIGDAGVTAPSDALRGDLCKEALYQVQLRCAGGREVQVETRVFFQPGPHLGRLVGGVVVEHDVDVAGSLHRPVDPAEEAQELLCAVARHAVADDQTRLHVERREQGGGAMAPVVVGHGRRAPLLQRQPGLRPVQRLDLGFLVDAQHDRTVRRVEVEPHDLGDLGLEHRVV